MNKLVDIPVSLDSAPLAERLRIPSESGDRADFERLLRIARDKGRPKALYREAFVESVGNGEVVIEGVTFTSRTLGRNLASVGRVFPYIATCGHEMDEVFPAEGDLLQEFWWDTIKAHLLGAAGEHLRDHLHSRFRLGKTSTMSPGAGDRIVWPIEQQELLFSLLGDVRAEIGVELTASFLMVPNKTVSGIRFPTEKDFRACQVCHREDCPSRSAPFDKELWESIEHD
jgi:hypothetical protein